MPSARLLLALVPIGAAVLYVLLSRNDSASYSSDGATANDAGNDGLADPGMDSFTQVAVGPIELGGTGLVQGFEAIMDSARARVSSWTLPARAAPYAETIAQAENANGIPPALLARVIKQESNFDALARGPVTKGGERAIGIAQLMPGTARELGVDPLDASSSIAAAGKYLRRMYDATGSWTSALAAYNWGIGNLQRKGIANAPAETRNYVSQITADVPV